jgi:hypothetical protein
LEFSPATGIWTKRRRDPRCRLLRLAQGRPKAEANTGAECRSERAQFNPLGHLHGAAQNVRERLRYECTPSHATRQAHPAGRSSPTQKLFHMRPVREGHTLNDGANHVAATVGRIEFGERSPTGRHARHKKQFAPGG